MYFTNCISQNVFLKMDFSKWISQNGFLKMLSGLSFLMEIALSQSELGSSKHSQNVLVVSSGFPLLDEIIWTTVDFTTLFSFWQTVFNARASSSGLEEWIGMEQENKWYILLLATIWNYVCLFFYSEWNWNLWICSNFIFTVLGFYETYECNQLWFPPLLPPSPIQ